MDFGWVETLLYAAVTGLSEILPVSVQAHSRIMVKFMGRGEAPALMQLFIHFGILTALYLCCQNHILKMSRARKMARIPKKKRKRPLDTRSMMDLSLWKTMLLPVILVLLIYRSIQNLNFNMIVIATLLFLNGLILYIPQFLPSSNKDCRMLSRVEGLLMGLAGGLFAIPGLSGTGAALSVASVTGVEKKYGLNMILLMNMGVLAGKIIFDLLDLISAGPGLLSLMVLIRYISAAAVSFLGAFFAVRLLRSLAEGKGYGIFAYYSWGLALFTFILTLMA